MRALITSFTKSSDPPSKPQLNDEVKIPGAWMTRPKLSCSRKRCETVFEGPCNKDPSI